MRYDNIVIVYSKARAASIFDIACDPEFAQIFLLAAKPPTDTVGIFANYASHLGETHQLFANPSRYEDGELLAPEARPRCRGAVVSAWRLDEDRSENKKGPWN